MKNKTDTNKEVELERELERELENRLQMIPSAYDRRKIRGLIQRIRTSDRKNAERQSIREKIAELLPECSGCREGRRSDGATHQLHTKEHFYQALSQESEEENND